ncbi:hypothetical protein JKP88DRAFT_255169 [Tribonema minus]|uniref:Uncharacterized protein n=1 Tax=Tribonema minus TaxID=303371 RepID=A0A835Z276_9STRA|nr:hypothetical protein JKP88DRAFT_255169 [Tribonema minus]
MVVCGTRCGRKSFTYLLCGYNSDDMKRKRSSPGAARKDVPAEVKPAVTFAALKHLIGCNAQVVVIEHAGGVAAAQEIFDADDNILWLGVSGNRFVIKFNRHRNLVAIKRRYGSTAKNIGRPQLLLLRESTTWDAHFRRDIDVVEPPYRDGFFNFFIAGYWRQVDAVEYTVGMTLNNMASNSKSRGHKFDKKTAAINIGAAYARCLTTANTKCSCPSGACGCGRAHCDAIVVLRGVHAASPDRDDDSLGYCDEGQVLTIISKCHNTAVKHDAVPVPRKEPKRWLGETVKSNVNRTYRRMTTLIKNIDDVDRTEAERSQVVRFQATTREQWKAHYTAVLDELAHHHTHCPKCNRLLDKGDSKGMMHFTNEPTQASPDRIDNSNPFYDLLNVRLVCQSCNYSENDYMRTTVERPSVNNPAEYPLDIPKVIKYLTSVIAAEARKENNARNCTQQQ